MKIFKNLSVFLLLTFAINGEKAPSLKPAPDRIEGDGPFERLIIRGANLIDGTGSPPRGPVDIVIDKNIPSEFKSKLVKNQYMSIHLRHP